MSWSHSRKRSMYVKFSNNMEVEQRGSYQDVKEPNGLTNQWLSMKKDIVVKLPSVDIRVNRITHLRASEFFPKVGLSSPSMDVVHLKHGMVKDCRLPFYGRNGESELNGSNLVPETTNKIVVYRVFEVTPWRVSIVHLERKTSLEPICGPLEILGWNWPIKFSYRIPVLNELSIGN
ncbi:hypothetical protein Tco_0690700 [Tanacetum coccineum]